MRCASAPPSVVPGSWASGARRRRLHRVLRVESGSGAAGAGGTTGGATAFGGSVEAPISGFSISIAPPHFEHFVRALGRSPSLDSSNLNLDWQLGQTTIIATHLRAPCGATLFGPASPLGRQKDNTNPAGGAAR
jgi:hypothetical protein